MSDVNIDVLLHGDGKDLNAALRSAKDNTADLRREMRGAVKDAEAEGRALDKLNKEAREAAARKQNLEKQTKELKNEIKLLVGDLKRAQAGLDAEGRALHGAARASRIKSGVTKQLAIDLKKQELSTRRAANALLEETKAAIAAAAGIKGKGEAAEKTATQQEFLALAAENAAESMEHEAVAAAAAAMGLKEKGRSSKSAARDQDDLTRSSRRTTKALKDEEQAAHDLRIEQNRSLGAQVRHAYAMRLLVRPLRSARMIGTAFAIPGVAASLNAAAAGATAFVGSIAPLAGGLGVGAVNTLGAIAIASKTVGFALEDVGKAIHDKDTFKELTDEGQDFVRFLRQEWAPAVGEMRRQIQTGLFPGMKEGLNDLERAIPVIQKIAYNMALAVGEVTKQAGARFSKKGFLTDALDIGHGQIHLVEQGGKALISVISGVRHILVAALPVTREFSRELREFGDEFEDWALQGRRDGSLREFFRTVLADTRQWWHILGNVGETLFNILVGSRDGTERMLDGLEQVTAEWAEWTGSMEGQNTIREWVDGGLTALGHLGRILGAIVGTFGTLSEIGNRSFGDLADFIEGHLLPAFEELMLTIDRLMPSMFHLLEGIFDWVHLIFDGLRAWSPVIEVVAEAIAEIMEVVHGLTDELPGVLKLPAALLIPAAVLKSYRLLRDILKEAAMFAGLTRIAGPGVGIPIPGRGKTGGYKGPVGFAPTGGSTPTISSIARTAASVVKHPAFIPGAAAAAVVIGAAIKRGDDEKKLTLPETGTTLPRVRVSPITGDTTRILINEATDSKLRRIAERLHDVDGVASRLGTKTLRRFRDELIIAANNAEALGDVELAEKLREEAKGLERAIKEIRDVFLDAKSAMKLAEFGAAIKNALSAKNLGLKERVNGILDAFREIPKGARKEAKRTLQAMVDQYRQDGKKPPAALRRALKLVSDEIDRSKKRDTQKMKDFVKGLLAPFSALPTGIGKGLDAMAGLLNSFLKSLGMDKVVPKIAKGAANLGANVIQSIESLLSSGKAQGGIVGKAAKGALVQFGRAGERGPDNILTRIAGETVAVGSGEVAAVFNGDQQQVINDRLADVGGLKGFFRQSWRPHSRTRGGMPGVRGFAQGGYPGVSGDTDFRPELGFRLSRMSRTTNRSIYVQSGGRTIGEQAALYARYLAGGPLAAAPNPNAPHVRGIAADITPGREVFGGTAGKFGLGFTVPSESWHIELLGGRIGGAYSASSPAPKFKLPRYMLQGVPGLAGEIGQRGLDILNTAARSYASSQSMTGVGGDPGGNAAENMRIGRELMLRFWGEDQWPALRELWMRESGWSATADNPTSTAYGIPQALTSMHDVGQAYLNGNATAQILWGLRYIKGRYGTPSAALAFHNAHNWYERGGLVGGDGASIADFIPAAIGYYSSGLQDPPNLDSQEGRDGDGGGGGDSGGDSGGSGARRAADQLLRNKPNPRPDYAAQRRIRERRKRRKGAQDRPDILRLLERKSRFHLGRDLRKHAPLKTPFNQMIEDQLYYLQRLEHNHGLTDEEPTIQKLMHAFVDPENPDKRLVVAGPWDGKTLKKNGLDFDGEFFQEIINWDGGRDDSTGEHVPGIKQAVGELSKQIQGQMTLKGIYGQGADAYAGSVPKILKKVIAPRRKYIGQLRAAWREMFKAVERFKEQKRAEIKTGGTWREKRTAHNKTIAQLKRWREKLRDIDPQTPYVQEQLEDVDRQIRWNENRVRHLEEHKPKGKDPEVVKVLDRLIARDGGYMETIAGSRRRLPAPGREGEGVLGAIRGQVHGARDTIGRRTETAKAWGLAAVDTQDLIDLLRKDVVDWWGTKLPYELKGPPSSGGAGGEDELKGQLEELLKEQISQLQSSLRVQGAQLDVFKGFARLPFLGSFQHGTPPGRVINETGMALLHKDETVLSDPDGPFRNSLRSNNAGGRGNHFGWEIHLIDKTKGGILELIDARVAKVAPRVTSRATGQRTRIIRAAPGR